VVAPIDRELLAACFEARARQLEMLPLLAAALGVPEDRVFYTWALARRCRQSQPVSGGPWLFWFHGFECDLRNDRDGRFLRYDFGPGGRADCVTAWGVLQFVMTATPPWREFPGLRLQLARAGPPYDHLSGDRDKVSAAWDRLDRLGCFEPANPGLVAFRSRHTSVGRDGISYTSYPEGTPDEVSIDCAVAHRPVLTARAELLLGPAEPPLHPTGLASKLSE
jgi:hypothetical protein